MSQSWWRKSEFARAGQVGHVAGRQRGAHFGEQVIYLRQPQRREHLRDVFIRMRYEIHRLLPFRATQKEGPCCHGPSLFWT